jgi:hypothetical protein
VTPECSHADGYSSSGHPTPFSKLLLTEDLLPIPRWGRNQCE